MASIQGIIICTIIVSAMAIIMAVLYRRATNLADELDAAEQRNRPLGMQSKQSSAQIGLLENEIKQIYGWLEHATKELNWQKKELATRPKTDRKVYKILTVGIKATGKSSLTLKWANPRVKFDMIEGTKIERYEKTVSMALCNDTLVEHVFEISDWGGEHIVDALHDLITDEFNGLLMVVDLGGKDARQVDRQRIAMQLEEFNPHVLRFFLGSKTVTSCKTVVLFINKSDIIEGSPAHAEAKARELYAPLIENLRKFAVDVKVLVGSASYGHSTHVLFSHFVEEILPASAMNYQLRQQLKSEPHEPPPSDAQNEVSAPEAPISKPKPPNRNIAPPPHFTALSNGALVPPKATLRLSNGSNKAERTQPLLQSYPTPPSSGQN